MFGAKPPRQPPHLPIRRDVLNGFPDFGIHAIAAAAPLEAVRMGNTVSIRLAGFVGAEVVRADGDIDAISGDTPGTGDVEVMAFAGPDFEATGATHEVLNLGPEAADGDYGLAVSIAGRRYWLPIVAGGTGLVLVKATGAITARSGSTPGTGSGVLVDYDGSTMADGSAITIKNPSACTFASGDHGTAYRHSGTTYVLVGMG